MGDAVDIQTGKPIYTDGAKYSGVVTAGGGGGGGGMSDVEQRLLNTERDIAQMRSDLGKIEGSMPHLATKSWVTGASGLLALVIVAMGLVNLLWGGSSS